MIKLLSWEDFIGHIRSVSIGGSPAGMCMHMGKLYCIGTKEYFQIWLNEQGYNEYIPINIGGYTRKCPMPWKGKEHKLRIKGWRAKCDRADKLYYSSNFEQKYHGIQGALRHNLYVRFCAYLVATHPKAYCYA